MKQSVRCFLPSSTLVPDSHGNFTEYEYDFRNRLTRVADKSSGGIILSEAEYTYDSFNRRITKSVNGTQTHFVYNGDNVWADFNADGTVAARYLFGNRIDEILSRHRPGEGTAWYLTDRLGTVRDLVDASGMLVNQVDYDSFGRIPGQTNAAASDRFLFTGREFDAESGLYYFRARYYEPVVGRFTSEDPLRFDAGDDNLYRYLFNSPANGIDPSGKAPITSTALLNSIVIGGAIGAIVGGARAVNDPGTGVAEGAAEGFVFGATGGVLAVLIGTGITLSTPAVVFFGTLGAVVVGYPPFQQGLTQLAEGIANRLGIADVPGSVAAIRTALTQVASGKNVFEGNSIAKIVNSILKDVID